MPKSENFAPMEQEQESQALDLIIEAINYCKKVRDLGIGDFQGSCRVSVSRCL